MILFIESSNVSCYRDELESAFHLRHQVFVQEKGWTDLDAGTGLETDQFDDEHAIHMVYVDGGEVLGYQRLLPTTRPHLLSEVLSELCEGPRPSGQTIWEWSRYCVDSAHRERGRLLSPIAQALLTGVVEWGISTGVDTVIIEMNPLWILRLVQLDFRVASLGRPVMIAGEPTVAVTASFDRRTLQRLQETRGGSDRSNAWSVFDNWQDLIKR